MNYSLNQLRVFLKVTETGSVTKAAEELNLTQPAVSIQLKNFQNQFDIPLTEVVGRKLYITDFGKEIAVAAENILNQVNAINFKTQEYKGQLTGRLKISVVSTGKYIMPYFLSGFVGVHSSVQLVMDVTNKAGVIASLVKNEVDFALVSILPPAMEIEKIDLLQNKLYLVGNGEQTFLDPIITKEAFKNLPLIYREPGSGTRQTMEDFIESNHINVLKKMELTTNEAVKQAILAGLGYSIMPLIGIKNELHNGTLKILPVDGLPITTVWSLIWLKDKKHSPVARAFLSYIEKEKKSIIERKFDWYEKY
jgi:DNA-binding transcriptional LysR family regulator